MPRLTDLFALCLLTITAPAFANGGLDESPHRTGSDVWTTGKRLTLNEEFLTFDLDATNYRVTVDYRLNDNAPKQAARMYFPVLCQQQSEAKQCLPQLVVSLNGNAVSARPATATPALKKASALLDERLKTQMSGDKSFEFVDSEQDHSAYLFYEIDLPAGQPLRQLAIQYQAPYLQSTFSTSKSPYYQFSPAYANYDFALAAAWAGGQTKALHITVNPPAGVGPLSFDQQQWPFQHTAGPLQLTINLPNFARLPPLTLALDNGGYLTFQDNMTLLNGRLFEAQHNQPVDYRIRVLSAKPAAQHNDPAALRDGNPNTFWCWKGQRASLEMTVPVRIGQNDIVPLYDVALLNGAAGALRGQYGAVRTLSVKADGYNYRDDQQTRFELPQVSTQDRYAGLQHTEELSLWWQTNQPKTVRLRIDVERSWPGGANDESCISELYPTYNPG